ncbi:MAG: ABC transporter substrate-binding protein [Ilumatobacteraceae bacterium]|nr:ABC transporter substrate-binding protein [Ilumatobacteraceae bacterium]
MIRTRAHRTIGAVLIVSAMVLAACGDDEKTSSDTAAATTEAAAAETTAAAATDTTAAAGTDTTAAATGDDPVAALYQECLDNGARVNLIALPDEWANYKGVLASFGEKFPGIEYPVQNPNASSQEELDAIVNLAGQDDMPDAIDVSPAKAVIATEQGLWQPFEPSTIGEVPDNMKDPDGNWVSAYYGIMSIGTITTIVPNPPKSFADLTKPEYKGLVALNGDPRESGSALAAVMAASIANGGSADDIMPGIQFFADLKASGNLIPTEVTQATVISGETPIALDWSYNYPGLAAAVEDAGFEIEINFPSDAAYGAPYAQGVVMGSPHQACAKLWIEHILSDEGALAYLGGGGMPARFAALEAAGAISEEDKANLPPADLLSEVVFLTPEQSTAANDLLLANWGPMVADA